MERHAMSETAHLTIRSPEVLAFCEGREIDPPVALALLRHAKGNAGEAHRLWESPTGSEERAVLVEAFKLSPGTTVLSWGGENRRPAETTDAEWKDEMLVIVTSKLEAGGDYPGKLVTAAEALEDYLDPQFRQAVQGVAQSGGTATVFMGQGGVVRAEIRRATRAEVLGQEDRLHEEDEGAPDVFSLREQLDEALDMLAEAAAPGGIGPHEFSRPGGYRERVIAILAKHGRKTD